ncbi:branched-chain amino acid ABC transporter permease [Rhizobium sp. AC27/96]|uniref:ABC transporter permease n=1 Tax=Rhizobium TaxID=379 RepID=UPI00082929A1|nr:MULTISPECIES: ABC transporter permease [Rhizobium]NTF45456.1 ABC transporter permease [Rhizobium rhizogenes]OCJ07222.1 branched-chain amino acid ABC transporter permease [Rhizobium sp. AC27/96]
MSATAASGRPLAGIARYGLIVALIAVFSLFSALAPTFLSPGNLQSILVNNFTLLAIVSIAMTFAVAAGGIDLSVGTAVDFASFAFVSSILAGVPVPLAALAGLGAGALVGAFNAVLISGIGVSPFLATLGTLFIGRSIQQLLTDGGNPVYLPPSGVPKAFRFIGHGTLGTIPVPLLIAGVIIAGAALLFARMRFGRVVLAIGIQPRTVRYSGIGLRAHVAATFILAGVIAAFAGLILTATVTVYIPSSGNGFMLNAIGATFIGTTFSPLGRPNVAGTVLGVLLLSIVANGLLLTGLNFYWQQVGTGLLIFAVLTFSFINKKAVGA